VRGSVQGRCDYTTALDIEVDAFEPERIVRSVLLQWQSSGNEVRRGLAVACRKRRRKNSLCIGTRQEPGTLTQGGASLGTSVRWAE